MRQRLVMLVAAAAGALPVAACGSDPQYLSAPAPIEVDTGAMDANTGTMSVTLPIELESNADRMARDSLSAQLGAAVPYVKLGDLDLEIEWTVKNLSGNPGQARISLTGANELNAYVPIAFVVNPREDQEPPPLAGNIPIDVGASAVVNGVFREDQLHEAAIDVEQITRGGVNPFAAILTHNEDDPSVTILPEGVAMPIADLAGLVRLDVTFAADQHMVLEWTVRLRDHRGIVHPDLADAPADELTPFAPADYAPPPPPMP
ncbi:MAG TPA: hypothetical protein VHE35_36580 [Kofleriaceae bacterium]|nr:hypothetical protein [Kofleriaceae bacterium]